MLKLGIIFLYIKKKKGTYLFFQRINAIRNCQISGRVSDITYRKWFVQ
jgi:hypothetical protein